MDYFNQEQFIAQVDKNDAIIGQVEKWEAHKKGILHRAFTVTLLFNNKIIVQHRKHPVFDDVYDATVSSHQIYKDDTLQSDKIAIFDSLKRECNISQEQLTTEPEFKGTIYYRAHDPKSDYVEHEVCRIYTASVTELPDFNPEFAYGYRLAEREDLFDTNSEIYALLAPWVKEALKSDLI